MLSKSEIYLHLQVRLDWLTGIKEFIMISRSYLIVLNGDPSSNSGGLNVSVDDFSLVLLLLLRLLLNLVEPLPATVAAVESLPESCFV